MKKPTATKFCSCIKKVRKTLKKRGSSRAAARPGTPEQRAIAICVKSMLQRRGVTLRKFTCRKKKMLETQPLK